MSDIYSYIEKNTFDIKDCISKYIGYIVSASFLSGFLSLFFSNSISSFEKQLLLLITGVVITLIFKIIWYKFKSHNRFEGFKYLISHEINFMSIDDLERSKLKKSHKDFIGKNENISKQDILNSKVYIKFYKDFICKKCATSINNIGSFINCMSRLNDSYFTNRNFENNQVLKNILKSSDNSAMFVFSLNDRHYNDIIVDNNSTKFFEHVIWNVYGRGNSKLSFFGRCKLIFFSNFVPDEEYFTVDEKYANMSWRYPKEITQIAFFSVSGLVGLQIIILYQSYGFTNNINFKSLLPLGPTMLQVGILIYWFKKYICKLEDLLFGRYSIEGYVWKFFLFRVQFLNSVSNVIPIYFSRNFVRFFKTNLIVRFIKSQSQSNVNEDDVMFYATISKNIYNRSSEKMKANVISKLNENNAINLSLENLKIELEKNNKIFETYYTKLYKLKKFNAFELIIHNVIKELYYESKDS